MAELTITKDREELERLEGIIEENIGAFYRVGKALMKIRDEQLYSKVRGIENFETYCRQRWDFNSSRARQLMAATETYENIKTVTPRNAIEAEFHLRPLSKLKDNPEVQREAWQKAVETAPEGKVTAAHVQKVVKSYQLKGGEDGEYKNRFSESTVSVDFGTIDAPEDFVSPFEAFYRQVQIARKERWTRTKRVAARICVKMLNDLVEN